MNKKQLLVLLFFLLLVVLLEGFTILKWAIIWGHAGLNGLEVTQNNNQPASLWIEVHDVSPGYGSKRLREITSIIDRHPDAADKVVLFVIPNHGGGGRLADYPEFVSTLKNLSAGGYTLGMHGYTHKGGIKNPEYNVDKELARELIRAGQNEFIEAGIKLPSVFAPPGWRASRASASYLREEFDMVYYAFFIDKAHTTLPYETHEYTWYDSNIGGLKKAKRDYQNSKGVFRLTLHLKAANTGKNLEFLDQFLGWIEKNKTQ